MIGTRPDPEGGLDAPPRKADVLARCWALLDEGAADQAARLADQVEARTTAGDGATPAARAELAAVRARCHLLRGDLDAAIVLQTLARRGHGHQMPPREVADLVDVVAQLGWFRQAGQLVAEHDDGAAGPVAEAAAGLALAEGRLGAALALARTALSAERTGPSDALVTERIAWVTGAALLERGHVTAALAPLRTACAGARRSRLQHVLARAAASLARAHALLGDPDAGHAVLTAARRPLHPGRLPARIRSWIDRAEVRVLLVEGDVDAAVPIVARLGGDHPDLDVAVLQAWTALAGSDPEAAGHLLGRSRSGEVGVGALIEADILRSRSAIGRAGVVGSLGDAVGRAAPDGHVAVFLEHGPDLVAPLRALAAVEPSAHATLLLDRLAPPG
jgi:hypothetical protein